MLRSLHRIIAVPPGVLALLLLLSPAVAPAAGPPDSPLAVELREQLQQAELADDSPLPREALERFYQAEQFQPVWLGPEGPNRRARLLYERLRQARSEGLVPQHYLLERIEPLWSSTGQRAMACLELLLSSAFFDYVRDVRRGRFEPAEVAPLWHIEPVAVDSVNMLRLALVADDFAAALDALPPEHPAYRRLRKALARYRALEAQGGWPELPSGPTLRPGEQDPRVRLLRRRLQMEGDLSLAATAADTLFDEGLVYAVKHFQVRHGLEVDGLVGRKTLAALNAPVGKRIEQIVLTMERWRWLPQQLGRRHIIVNLPAYELIAYEDDVAQMSMPVIIGTRERPTPVTAGLLHTVVINPYWTVPRKIAVKDLLPKQRRDPDYLPSHGIRVFTDWNGTRELDPGEIDWDALNQDNFPYMLRQDPGPYNALGQVKFLFSNRFSVYLHDTPEVWLFGNSVRANSSGCIRVEEPIRLANFLLQGEQGWSWSEEMVKAVIQSRQTEELALSAALPVYLLYLTVWVGEDDAVHFRRDVYGEDALLAMCMPFEEQTL
jgi:murein L,D-transpeptidase YcbB/YkuD